MHLFFGILPLKQVHDSCDFRSDGNDIGYAVQFWLRDMSSPNNILKACKVVDTANCFR